MCPALKNVLMTKIFLTLLVTLTFYFFRNMAAGDDEFELDGYESILVPHVESINNSSKRGNGGIALFTRNT